MNRTRKIIFIYLLPIIAGAVLGFCYYKFIGCKNGVCPIVSSPVLSIVFGAVIGYTLLSTLVEAIFAKKDKKTETKKKNTPVDLDEKITQEKSDHQ